MDLMRYGDDSYMEKKMIQVDTEIIGIMKIKTENGNNRVHSVK